MSGLTILRYLYPFGQNVRIVTHPERTIKTMSTKTTNAPVSDVPTESDVPALPAIQDSLPTATTSDKLDVQPIAAESYNFIVADENVRNQEVSVVAGLVARAAATQYESDLSHKEAAKEMNHFRRMFRAPERIRKILGNEDAPDLFGASQEYRDALKEVNKKARKDLIDAILAETPDLSQKAAEGEATDLLKRFDSNMKRELRILLDREFRPMGAEGARIMLCYGFKHTSAIKSTQTIPEGWSIEEKTGKLVVPVAKPIGPPQTDTSQVKAGESAPALNEAEKEQMEQEGGDRSNPLDLINRAIVLLRDAEGLMAQKGFNFPEGVTMRTRQQTKSNLFKAAKSVTDLLIPVPPANSDKQDKTA